MLRAAKALCGPVSVPTSGQPRDPPLKRKVWVPKQLRWQKRWHTGGLTFSRHRPAQHFGRPRAVRGKKTDHTPEVSSKEQPKRRHLDNTQTTVSPTVMGRRCRSRLAFVPSFPNFKGSPTWPQHLPAQNSSPARPCRTHTHTHTHTPRHTQSYCTPSQEHQHLLSFDIAPASTPTASCLARLLTSQRLSLGRKSLAHPKVRKKGPPGKVASLAALFPSRPAQGSSQTRAARPCNCRRTPQKRRA